MRIWPIVVGTILVAGCAAPSTPQAVPSAPSAAATDHTSSPPQSPVTPSPALHTQVLSDDFAAFSSAIPAEVGVAIVSGPKTWSFGSWTTGTAWSTIKVPLAIAALRADPDQAPTFVAPAIRQSDNGSAESLWSLLGAPRDAAQAVQSVLGEGGDATTVVESERIRPGFTAFGQTNWPLSAEATFAWRLPCVEGAQAVVADMRQIAGDQLWGLANNGDVAAKGGWGPEQAGGYLVRQLASISTPIGTLGVALAAEPADGSFGSGVAAINRLAEWVNAHRDSFAPTAC